uniref:Uncharacterized protein n=1 Tax=Arion vulgaris TaxID=1028688 RepID=A0A0B7BF27_9EUPU
MFVDIDFSTSIVVSGQLEFVHISIKLLFFTRYRELAACDSSVHHMFDTAV